MTVARYGAVLIGASAGGTSALKAILAPLPSNFPVPILVVQHVHPLQKSASLVHVTHNPALIIKDADQNESLQAGHVYFAPPNYHLLVEEDRTLSLSIDPKVNFTRPAVDVLFESAVDAFGALPLVGIVLSGANNDGAAGLRYLKQRGGLSIVQDPASAEVSYMPQAAIQAAHPAHILPPEKIGALLVRLFFAPSEVTDERI
jgi:two-component system, chemotaxis family, protein-glutamate methylesterase/glutaminase